MAGFNLYEISDPKEHSLQYKIEKHAPGVVKASNTTDDAGRRWKLICTFPTREAAEARKTGLENENLIYGIFKVKQAGGDERYEMKRVPQNHPRKIERNGETWTLMQRHGTEGKAAKALAKMNGKAADRDDRDADDQDVLFPKK